MTTRWHAGLFVFFILSGIAGMSSPARGEQDSAPAGEPFILRFDSTPGKHENATPQWSGITLEQVIKHLQLEGGNASVTFKQPVYLRLRESRRSASQAGARPMEMWSDKPAMEFTLSVLVSEQNPPAKLKDDERYRHVDVHWSSTIREPIKPDGVLNGGVKTDDRGGGWGANVILKTQNQHFVFRYNKPGWIELEQEVLLYEFFDPDAPTESFYRLTALFTATPPPSKPDPAAESKQE